MSVRQKIKRGIKCPPPCGQPAVRIDTRKTTLPRLLRVRLYRCNGGHDFESAETIVGLVRKTQRRKTLINRYTIPRKEGRREREEDYKL